MMFKRYICDNCGYIPKHGDLIKLNKDSLPSCKCGTTLGKWEQEKEDYYKRQEPNNSQDKQIKELSELVNRCADKTFDMALKYCNATSELLYAKEEIRKLKQQVKTTVSTFQKKINRLMEDND